MRSSFTFSLLAAAILYGPMAGPASAQTDLSKFPLARAVPDDVFLAVSARTNPERAFLDAYWEDVLQAFRESGITSDIWDLITDQVPDEALDEFEATAERFSELCGKVSLSTICEKEFVHAGRLRFGSGPVPYEGVFMGRSSAKAAAANYSALAAILKEVRGLVEEQNGEGVLDLTEEENGGVKSVVLGPAGLPQVGIRLAQRKDVILVGFGGTGLVDDCLDLLKRGGKNKSLVGTARFKAAFAQLPAAEDSLFFFDIDRMMRTIDTFVGMMSGPPPQAGGPSGPAAGREPSPFKLVSTLIDDISIVDYVASVEWTDGFRVFSDTVSTLKDGKKSSPVCKILTSGQPVKHFEKFIPKESETFWVSSGVNLTEIYDYIEKLVKENVPDGAQHIGEFNRMQKEWELDIKKDVLGLIEGSIAGFSAGKDWVLMVRVTDEDKAQSQMNRLLDKVNEALGEQNALMMSPVKVGAKRDFKQVSHPMMMMMGGMSPPVFGCAEGHFIVGSSTAAVKNCLNTGGGKHPNITRSKRWRAEALQPDGPVTSISFTDESRWAEEMQQAIAGMSMGLGMVGAMGAANAPPPVRKIMNAIPPLLAKLGPVVGKITFFQSNASYETFDGKRWYSRAVQNYKAPTHKEKEEVKKVSAD